MAAENSQTFFKADAVQVPVGAGINRSHSQPVGEPRICLKVGCAGDFLQQEDVCLVFFYQAGKGFQAFHGAAVLRPVMPEVGADHREASAIVFLGVGLRHSLDGQIVRLFHDA